MDIVLLGAPGSGKGTQGDRLVARLKVPRVSTGDLLREAVRAGAPLGREAQGYMKSGKLVPDAVVDGLLQERLRREDARKGFLLDGYPRNLSQARSLEAFLGKEGRRLDHVIYLEVQEAEVKRRLTARRVCKCGAVYHLENAPPKREGVCDACGGKLIHRDDDREEVIAQRLRVYREETEPLLQWYEGRGLLRRVPAMGGMDEISGRVETLLEEHGA